jgi:four helix bundle protein
VSSKSVHDLEIWQDSIALVKSVYLATRVWPPEELYGLVSQTRRAAISIPTNLAEGRGRQNPGEVRRFSMIARASAFELDTLLQIASDLGFHIPEGLRSALEVLIRRITSFIRYQETKLP